MRYEVPQFIEEETKIIGPLSIRQFFFYLAGLIISFLFFFIFKTWLWVVLTIILFGGLSILSFGKVHGRPLSSLIVQVIRYFWLPKLFLWQKAGLKPEEFFREEKKAKELPGAKSKPKSPEPLTPEKIKALAQQLDKPKQ